MRRLRLRRTLVVIGALTLGLTVPATSGAQAADPINLGEASMTATVTEVLVNSAGGIRVSGTIDCTTAFNEFVAAVRADPVVTSWMGANSYTGLVDVRLTTRTSDVGWVWVSPDFTATQYVGRTRVITADYGSGIARSCYTEGVTAPYPWSTLYGFPVGTEQWIYSSTGKFSPGSIHVEMKAQGEIEAIAYGMIEEAWVEIGTFKQSLYALSGWDLRAQKVRR